MTTMTHETEITADDKVPVIRITREFDAPPAKVFRAHADPELLAHWLGPRDLETTIDYFDCRTGGAYRYVQRAGRTSSASMAASMRYGRTRSSSRPSPSRASLTVSPCSVLSSTRRPTAVPG